MLLCAVAADTSYSSIDARAPCVGGGKEQWLANNCVRHVLDMSWCTPDVLRK